MYRMKSGWSRPYRSLIASFAAGSNPSSGLTRASARLARREGHEGEDQDGDAEEHRDVDQQTSDDEGDHLPSGFLRKENTGAED